MPGSLFVVGDPKQSIYRFRRADIVTYHQVKEIITAAKCVVFFVDDDQRVTLQDIGRKAALKVLNPAIAHDQGLVARFLAESKGEPKPA